MGSELDAIGRRVFHDARSAQGSRRGRIRHDVRAVRGLERYDVDEPRARFLGRLTASLPDGARLLDLGCGAGLTSRRLATRFAVTGVDISTAQLVSARENAPSATFLEADLASVEFERAAFDAVVALYSIIHVPREEHAAIFRRIASWLAPGGWFLASLGADDRPDWTGEWLGVPMFFSSFDATTNRSLVRDAGFDLLADDVITIREPEGEVAFLWVLARAT